MDNKTSILQKAGLGSTQIGEQNNYYGMTSEQACKMAIDLFWENFPKLIDEAKNTAAKRAEELINEIINNMIKNGVSDFSSLRDPDAQFILFEAQKCYARFGTQELLSMLSSLIEERLKNDEYSYTKKIIDQAVTVVNVLSPKHLDYLSVLFLLKTARFPHIQSISSLKKELEYIEQEFPLVSADNRISILISSGCLELHLEFIQESLSRIYGFNMEEVKKICPQKFLEMHPDYTVSDIGIVLAIVNAQTKNFRYKLDIKTWIKD